VGEDQTVETLPKEKRDMMVWRKEGRKEAAMKCV
jgi:hypothetical protein